jgi:hypothetical protein
MQRRLANVENKKYYVALAYLEFLIDEISTTFRVEVA